MLDLSSINFKDIYCTDEAAALQSDRYANAVSAFKKAFEDKEPEAVFSAPGRTEVGGNHTDHQHGEVLAASINKDAIAMTAIRDDNKVNILAEGFGMTNIEISDLELREDEKGSTPALIRGVLKGLKDNGYKLGGFDAYITSDVLIGAGLSSSAAFEVLLGCTLDQEYEVGTDAETIAKAGQFAENIYFGKPSGLLDQIACAEGGLVAVDFNDPANPLIRRLETDFDRFGHELYIIDSGAGHENLTGEYAAIPSDCQKISRYFGVNVLRDVEEDAFMSAVPILRERFGDRAVLRAIHFFGENRRAKAEAGALQRGDFDAFLELVRESGRSSALYLQNVIPAGAIAHQEMMLTLAVCEKLLDGKGAVRVHGGGFGGTALAIVPKDMADDFVKNAELYLGSGRVHRIRICPEGGCLIR